MPQPVNLISTDMKQRKSAIKYTSRHQLIDRLRRELEHRGYPRLQMLLLVSLTGGAGFLASYGLLHAGMETLSWRYGLSVGIAYGFFLLLLWLWLRTDVDTYDGLAETLVDVAEAVEPRAGDHKHCREATSEPLVELPDVPGLPEGGALPDADELTIPLGALLLVVSIVVTVLVASVSIVYSAPVLFAELLLDGVLAASLYRRLRHLDSRHWLQSAVRRTFVPFAITALLIMTAGWALSIYAPTARSLGEVLGTR
jgi:hypothetical protein